MDRPRVLTVLAYLYVLLGAAFLLAALPAANLQDSYPLFGAWVSARTFSIWVALSGGVWLFFAYSFFQGLELGLYAYLGLKAAHWGVTLLSGDFTPWVLAGGLIEACVLGAVWTHREWFRN